MSAWLFNFGFAWLALTTAFALHVADEASHNFLDWYNPAARRIRRYTGVLRFPPVFTFWPWILGLALVTLVAFAFTPWAMERRSILRVPAVAFALINFANGLFHMIATLVVRRRVPGVLSSPFLVAASLWLAYAAARL